MSALTIGRGEIEYRLWSAAPPDPHRPALVFLHEGLGCVELWRDFPEAVRTATGFPATLVYSRHGYGQSVPVTDRREPGYLHTEALNTLPALLGRLGIVRPVLIGHSDGGSIALIYAGAGHPVAGLVLIAPHVFVEDRSVEGIQAARRTYLATDLPTRMARYHRDPDSTFWGWNRVWLSPEFRTWNIEEYLGAIQCPVLLVQEDADPYGTQAQLDAVERSVAGQSIRLELPGGGHAPHLDHPVETVAAIARFVGQLQDRRAKPPSAEPS